MKKYWLSTVMEQTTQNLVAHNNNHFIMFMTGGSDLQGLGGLPPVGLLIFGTMWLMATHIPVVLVERADWAEPGPFPYPRSLKTSLDRLSRKMIRLHATGFPERTF